MCPALLTCYAKNELLQHIGETIEHKSYNDDDGVAIQVQYGQE